MDDPQLNIWFGKSAVLICLLGYSFIRAPHGHRSRTARIKEDRKDVREIVLLLGAFAGTTLLPLLWVITGFPAWADYPLRPVPYGIGLLMMAAGLWLFYRAHADLGANWSITLQMREEHHLVIGGIYRRIRHPMYTSMFILGVAHLFFVPNWIVAPAYLLSFGVLYFLRVANEERMMLNYFGDEYRSYMQRTGRLLPRMRS